LLDKLSISVDHLRCLDEVFRDHVPEYQRIEEIFNHAPFQDAYMEISRELYAGGKQPQGGLKLARQMILGDVIEYIFTGRAYYFAAKSKVNFQIFMKLILYVVNQLLLFDSITVRPDLRKAYIEKLEEKIPLALLYEKPGDKVIAKKLKTSNSKIWDKNWATFDSFVDSILPKTLGCPKELIVFAELLRSKRGIVIPLLLIQKIFGDKNPIAPPDFLLMKGNKEIFGIEVGYEKEGQSREFSIRTSIPTFAVDLRNNMHNRCPKCGENILYCDQVIEAYAEGTLETKLVDNKFKCQDCPIFDNGRCKFSNYYGKRTGNTFYGEKESGKDRHYHAACVLDDTYKYRNVDTPISDHIDDFFAQIPQIVGLESI
jgi:hypothetical protein